MLPAGQTDGSPEHPSEAPRQHFSQWHVLLGKPGIKLSHKPQAISEIHSQSSDPIPVRQICGGVEKQLGTAVIFTKNDLEIWLRAAPEGL